jgi:hypothetical protein
LLCLEKNEHFAGFIDIFLISDSGYLNHGTAGSANYDKFAKFAQKYHIFMGKLWAKIDNRIAATDRKGKHGCLSDDSGSIADCQAFGA